MTFAFSAQTPSFMSPPRNKYLLWILLVAALALTYTFLRAGDPQPTLPLDDDGAWRTEYASGNNHSQLQQNHRGYRDCVYLDGLAHKGSAKTCRMLSGDYADGKWVQNCVEQIDNVLQDPVFYTYGRWLEPKPDLPYRRGHPCFHSLMPPVDYKRKAMSLLYTWQPNSCDFLPFNANHFVSQLTKRKILFVGDSLLFQLVDSIEYLTGYQVDALKSWLLVDYRTLKPMEPDVYEYCACVEARLTVYNNSTPNSIPYRNHSDAKDCPWPSNVPAKDRDTLCPPIPPNGQYHRELRSMGWTSLLREVKYDTLVFSIGHHWFKEDPQYERYPSMIRNVVQWLRDNFEGTAIYVTAPPGHAECYKYDAPVNQFQFDDNPIYAQYRWKATINAQSEWAAALSPHLIDFSSSVSSSTTRKTPQFAAHILNLTTLTNTRPDGHWERTKDPRMHDKESKRDCLHWCHPGPVDSWVHVLSMLLMRLNEVQGK